jgi:uncharacterized protein (TIGR02284 family)
MDSSKTVSTLNDLIETSRNGEKGFRLAAEHAHDTLLKSLLQRFADDCGRAARELQQCVVQAGGKPEEGGTAAGVAHRAWLNLKTAITTNDDAAILEECERGEDHAKAIYKKALKEGLPSDVQPLVERQYQGTLQHHDRIKELRDQYAHTTH